MMSQKLHLQLNPIEAVPFEAFYRGSWHGVNLLSIKNGCLSIQLNFHGSVIEDTICGDFLRLRSRKACASDCSHFLKAGVDVCVLSTHPITEGSDEETQEPMLSWVDAKIMSIKRDHLEGRCACLVSVVLSKNKAPTSYINCTSEKVTTEIVTVDRIAILQKLHCEPREDGFHHWTSSEDWNTFKRSRLLTDPISSEVSWLIVYSILKGMDFNVKLVQNRIVYHIINYGEWSSKGTDVQFYNGGGGTSPNSEENIKILSFRRSNETLKPKIETLFQPVLDEMTTPYAIVEMDLNCKPTTNGSDVEILYDYVTLRRSKRRKLLPDRFSSYSEPNFNRGLTKKLSDDANGFEQSTTVMGSLMIDEEPYQTESENDTGGEINLDEMIEWLPTTQDVRSTSPTAKHNKLVIKNKSDYDTARPLFELPLGVEIVNISDSESPKKNSYTEIKRISYYESPERNSPVRLNQDGSRARIKKGRTRIKKGRISSYKTHYRSWLKRKKYSNGMTKQNYYNRLAKLLSSSECRQLLEKFMTNPESEMDNQHQPDVKQSDSTPAKFIDEFTDFKWSSDAETETEVDENEELWKEMEDSLTTLSLLEQKQKLDAEFFGQTNNISDNDAEPCQHVYKLNEQIGMVCILCNFVGTEIRYVTPPMFQNDGMFSSREKWRLEDLKSMGLYNLESDDPLGDANMSSEVYDNVWSSISDLKPKLHSHQKRAFEFIWRNIAGSLQPENMNKELEKTGGCVISHSPGSGKTLSVISFLVSYLRLYPGSRPLILAPKNAAYIWWKEFEKWGVSTPVHLIHPLVSYKKEIWDPKAKPTSANNRRPNVQMMHVIDCLSKLKQWRESPSVLVLSYPAFFCFTYKESKYEYRKFMAEILLKSPGLLILDEGHNPRSTISKLRKQLMKVNTELRILLSGTLFQNNFEEYFNTLSLARPRFVDDVIKELDQRKYSTSSGRKLGGRKINRKERLARKLFVEEIGQKIESENEAERKKGFYLLNKTTNGFIDSHDGDMSDVLPGLHIYTIMLNSTQIQREILTKLQNSISDKRFHFELELLITVGSIHPWLVKTVASVDDYFNADELEKIERYKKNFSSGSKVKVLVDLVHKSSIRGERVLVFCHNIPPINFLVELFDDVFGWSRGKEVLVLQGDQELFERARIMDKFNTESDNKCKVLIASTLACAEGISLTAASRVVLLDSEWNHAKTRQAIARAFRPGQKKMVYVYRLLALDTWEEDKYNSNEWKAWLSKMIFLGKYIDFTCSEPVEELEDEMLKEVVDEDRKQAVQMITKQE